MPKDNGGWSSRGTKVRIKCPRCGNDDATLLETEIYARISHRVFCSICAHDWIEQERDNDEGDSHR